LILSKLPLGPPGRITCFQYGPKRLSGAHEFRIDGVMVSPTSSPSGERAALTMNKDLGFTAYIYGWGAGIFFFGYFLFEIPSNLILERVGARLWIARIMITWGIISGLTAFVTGPTSFLVIRFLLGAAEAGFFPGAPMATDGRAVHGALARV
jgi:MFS family permease